MKLSKQELKQKISDSIDDEDLVIGLLEDIEDSMTEDGEESVLNETLKKENEELKWKYEDLKNRYKERFLKGEEKKDESEDETEELEEQEIIDVKEI